MIQIDFEKFNEAGLKPILGRFRRAGLPIVEVEATNKGKRESGFLTKSALIVFESGQKLFLKTKVGGGIFQIKLNNKVIPVKAVDDLDKAISEVVALVKENEKFYLRQKKRQIALGREQVKVPRVRPGVRESEADQLAAAISATKQNLERTREETETLQARLVAKRAENAAKATKITALKSRLQFEEARGRKLQKEHDSLKAGR